MGIKLDWEDSLLKLLGRKLQYIFDNSNLTMEKMYKCTILNLSETIYCKLDSQQWSEWDSRAGEGRARFKDSISWIADFWVQDR